MGPDQRTKDLWRTLRENGADLVLSGHEADYERFPRLDENGRNDLTGPRQFVVGTGGQIHYRPEAGDAPWRAKLTPVESDVVDFDHHGVLALTIEERLVRLGLQDDRRHHAGLRDRHVPVALSPAGHC